MNTETLNEKLARFELTISDLQTQVAKLSNTKPVVDNRVSDLQTQVAKLSNTKPVVNYGTVKDEIESTVTKEYITKLYRG